MGNKNTIRAVMRSYSMYSAFGIIPLAMGTILFANILLPIAHASTIQQKKEFTTYQYVIEKIFLQDSTSSFLSSNVFHSPKSIQYYSKNNSSFSTAYTLYSISFVSSLTNAITHIPFLPSTEKYTALYSYDKHLAYTYSTSTKKVSPPTTATHSFTPVLEKDILDIKNTVLSTPQKILSSSLHLGKENTQLPKLITRIDDIDVFHTRDLYEEMRFTPVYIPFYNRQSEYITSNPVDIYSANAYTPIEYDTIRSSKNTLYESTSISLYMGGEIHIPTPHVDWTGTNNTDRFLYDSVMATFDNLNFLDGNDAVRIAFNPPKNTTINMGNGNNTVEFTENYANLSRFTFTFGAGNQLIDLKNATYNKGFVLPTGSHTIQITGTGTYNPPSLTVPTNSTVALISSAGTYNISNIINNGTININIWNNALWTGTHNITGTVVFNLLNGGRMSNNLTLGGGNDQFLLDATTTTFSVDARGGTNTLFLRNNANLRGSLSSTGGVAMTTIMDSSINHINFGTGITGGSMEINNSTIATTSGVQVTNSGSFQAIIRNTITFTNAGTAMQFTNGNITIEFRDTSFVGNLVPVNISSTQNVALGLNGNISIGNINIHDGSSSISFGSSARTNALGTISLSNRDDTIEIINGSNITRGTLDFRGSTSTDKLEINNSTLNTAVNYSGRLLIDIMGTGLVASSLNANNSLEMILNNDSRMTGTLQINTTAPVQVSTKNNAIMNAIRFDTTKAVRLSLSAENNSSINIGNLTAGAFNDSINVRLINSSSFTGRVEMGAGNDTFSLEAVAGRFNATLLDLGAGDDSLILRNGTAIAGGNQISLGTGNNTLEIQGTVTLTNNLAITETTNTTNRITLNSNAHLTSSIHTGQVSGIVALGTNSTVTGAITAVGELSVSLLAGSRVTGNITTGTGNATINGTNALFGNNITANGVGRITSTLTNTTVQGGITGTNQASSTFTLGNSSIVGAINVGGGNDSIIATTSTLAGGVQLRNNSTLRLENNSTTNAIQVFAGSADITIHTSRVTGTLTTATGNDTVTMVNATMQNIIIGAGTNSVSANNTQLNSLTLAGTTTLTMQNNTVVTTSVEFNGTITANITGATIPTLNANAGSSNTSTINTGTITTLNLTNSTNTLTLQDSTVTSLITTNGTNAVTIENTTVNLLDVNESTNTIIFNGVTLHEARASITAPIANTVTYTGNNFLTGEDYDFGSTTTVVLNGEVSITRPVGATNLTTTMKGDVLELGGNGAVHLLQGGSTSLLKLEFNSLVNNSATSTFTIYTDVITGNTTRLDISSIANHTGNTNMVIHVVPNVSTTTGTPLEEILDVVISNAHVIPSVEGIVLAGFTYELEKSKDIAKPNTYNLVKGDLSKHNYAFSAAYSSMHSYNTSIFRAISAHFQEEQNMARNKEGKKNLYDDVGYYSIFSTAIASPLMDIEEDTMTNAFSVWARGGYAHNSQTAQDIPTMSSVTSSAMIGVDVASIPMGYSSSLVIQFFANFSSMVTSFSGLDDGITMGIGQTGISAGGSIGFEWLSFNNRGKLFLNISSWYSMVSNTVSSNKLKEDNIWNITTYNALASAGYSIYFSGIILTPQIDIYYSHTPKQSYLTPDGNMIEFFANNTTIGKVNFTLAGTPIHGITPYARGGAEFPIMSIEADKAITFAGQPLKGNYEFIGFSANVTAGISFRTAILNNFILTASAEVSTFFGEKQGWEAVGQIGFAF